MQRITFLLLLIALTSQTLHSQVYSNKVVGEKQEVLIDSLKAIEEYPYIFPAWGKKVTALGFDIPYSAGFSINSLTQKSELVIDNISVGFNDSPLINVDEIIRIDKATASATGLTVRPDIWVLPFLNVYGIFGWAKTSTEIDAGLWLPDSNNVWKEVVPFGTTANFNANVTGFGITPTMGVGGGWIALDMNFAWTDVDALDKPVKTFIFDPRIGKTFKFKKPNSNIAVWVGGFRVKFSSETTGSLPLTDLFPDADIQGKVDQAMMNVDQRHEDLDAWWNGLSELEMANPINKAKYETGVRVLDNAGQLLTSIDGAINDDQEATVNYSLEKGLKDPWNFIVGGQYQLNKNWMFRAEYGFLGTRNQFLASLQYRFRI